MNNKLHIDNLEAVSFLNGLVFFAPVALLVRTRAGISLDQFFILQAILSVTIFLGEIPTGKITDIVGYKNTIVLSQVMLLIARSMMLVAFLSKSYYVFAIEAIIEGIANCFTSGTISAYLYQKYDEGEYVVKSARVGNFGTAGFIISTIMYAGIYHFFSIEGLLILTASMNVIAVLTSLGIEKDKTKATNADDVATSFAKEHNGVCKKLFILKLNAENIIIMVTLACVSISFILINFFYVDKLEILGISEEWMTAIILGYSVFQMAAEKILDTIGEKNYFKAFVMGFILSGICMLVFGRINIALVIIPIMLILPLIVSVPAYIFDEMENKVIDKNHLEDKRAEVLSAYNMGVNFVEVVFLFASAFVAGLGVSACFTVVGVLMILLAGVHVIKR
ncbi:Major Facilitator Superfamily protein [Butyrivibrio fibrisolvens DSM 3071]|uniref:Major Facilitator Superfamily protein n=1 Tax=Butyrivibrio fibrisolvens DSM 3071 TaxID=1121131 RepID=A0A1M6DZG3_BUTFI|nr:MFS transporter [Butyrivibrio fibrisolvens]SHI78616.1 Major Facilitator Superfamily protein [Butyrivibrio fibrisolvens DSM 3071]